MLCIMYMYIHNMKHMDLNSELDLLHITFFMLGFPHPNPNSNGTHFIFTLKAIKI